MVKEKIELTLEEVKAFGATLQDLPIKYMPVVQLFEKFLFDKFQDEEVKTDDNGNSEQSAPSQD